MRLPRGIVIVLASLTLVSGPARAAAEDAAKSPAEQILKDAGVAGGLWAYLDYGDGKLTRTMAAEGKFIIHGLSADRKAVARAAKALDAADLVGLVSVEYHPLDKLPYADNLVNAVICEDLPAAMAKGLSLDEISRALAPLGVACLGFQESETQAVVDKAIKARLPNWKIHESPGRWLVIKKPWPDGMDVWSHWKHLPDGNLVSQDKFIGPPKSVRWMAGPFLGSNNRGQSLLSKYRAVAAMVSSGGRNFLVMRAPGDGMMAQRAILVARDGFNGTLLWTREFPNGLWKSNVVAEGGKVFVGSSAEFYQKAATPAPAEVMALDAATGEVVWRLEKTKTTGLIHHKGLLLLLGGPLKALDAATGKEKWTSKANIPVDDFWPPATGIGAALDEEGHLFFRSGATLTCVEAVTGDVKWAKDTSDKLPSKGCAIRFAKAGIVLFKEARQAADDNALVFNAFSTKDGSWLWSYTAKPSRWGAAGGDPWLAAGLVWVIQMEQPPKFKGSVLAMWNYEGLDPLTGQVKKKQSLPDPMRGDGCFEYSYTERFMIGNRPMYFMDWQSGKAERFDGARGACETAGPGIGLANGLLYHLNTGERSSGNGGECQCNPSVCHGLVAFASDDKTEHGEVQVDEQGRLERGPAADDLPAATDAAADSWPMYRHDGRRSAATATAIPDALGVAWTQRFAGAKPAKATVGQDWELKRVNCDPVTGATAADGRVFVSLTDRHKLVALDQKTGKPLWSYTAGGRLDTPPTIHNGLCLLGSHDGWVYCIRAKDGALAWRLRAAPVERRIVNAGQVESSWPVVGGVLVEDGVGYAVAGITSVADGGCYVTAFDPRTGKVAWSVRRANSMTGDWGWVRKSFVGAADLLASDGKTITIGGSPDGRLDPKTGQDVTDERYGGPRISLFWWRYGASFRGMDHIPLAADGNMLFGGGFREATYFDRAKAAQDLYATRLGKPGEKATELWRQTLPKDAGQRVESVIKAGDKIVAAISCDKADQPPGEVWLVSDKDGTVTSKVRLDAAPAYEGLAAAGGAVYVTLQDGSVVCLGKAPSPAAATAP